MTTKARTTKSPSRPDVPVKAIDHEGSVSVVESWSAMPWSIRLLRAFLGVTFVFAGAQKLLDPNFLHPGTPDYIGTQLNGFARATPAGPLMALLARVPLLTGVGVAITEMAVGLGVLLGVALLAAAVVGFGINVTLLFSATWHVHPYFIGSDSIYALAWLVLVVSMLEGERRRGRVPYPLARIDGLGRREFVRGGLVAGLTVLLAIASKAFAGPPATDLAASVGSDTSTGSPGSSGGPPTQDPSTADGSSEDGGQAVGGRVLTTLDQLPIGMAVAFTAAGGVPAALVRLANDRVVAYSRVCTHAGCSVGYDQSARILVCPCHGAEFDPAHGGEPIAGPTNTPLQSIEVVLDQASGKIILPA
jgi:thiosulfate dehydrogenase [quinone] large subunit